MTVWPSLKYALGTTSALCLLVSAASADPKRYELDPTHTTFAFLVDHLGYAKTLGLFLEFDGSFTYDMDNQALSDVTVTVETKSVESFNEARDNHVRSKDFLNSEAFPLMTFTADSGIPTGETTGTVPGELTLLGKTLPLELEVTLNKAANYPFGHGKMTLGISARGKLKRSDFGMSYAVDNGFVGDEVELIIETEANEIAE